MKRLETDVAVVAGSTAGLAAAELGVKVIIFEKQKTTGGDRKYGDGSTCY